MLNKIIKDKDLRILIISFSIMLISPLLMGSSIAFFAFLGVFAFITSICLFFRQTLCFIDRFATKTRRRSILTYGIFGAFFTFVFFSQIYFNTPDLLQKLSDSYSMTKYTIGTIKEINGDTMTVVGFINNKEELFVIDQAAGEVNSEITVFFNPNNLKICSIISPTVFNMLYFLAYVIVVGIPFLFCFAFDKRFYRLFKPKKIIEENNSKVKVKK